MDEIDRKLVALLRTNARTPVAVLSKALKVSRGTVQNRIDRMMAAGAILGFTLRVRPDAEAERVRAIMQDAGIRAVLEVDGGITTATIAAAHAAGADTFVVGTAVFGEPDISEAVRALKRACLTRV